MEENGPKFPNGQLKSHLYESVLRHSDFDCGPDKYAEEIAVLRRLEQNGQPICCWSTDVDGRSVVTQLLLSDPYVRVEITKRGFRKIPAASSKAKAALSERAETTDQLKALFKPRAAIEKALDFAGRITQINQIVGVDLSRGALFHVVGERSTGKTSLLHMLRTMFEGDWNILDYCGLRVRPEDKRLYRTVCADISGGLATTDLLAAELSRRFCIDHQPRKETSTKVTFGAPGILRFEQGTTVKPTNDPPVLQVINQLKMLKAYNEHPVVLIDEFDFFRDTETFGPVLRTWLANGLICFLVASDETFHSLVGGHISLARDVNRIELGPMSREEFREIFYVAATRCQGAIQFDSGALDALYEAARGLPYFAQLFGSILLDVAARRLGGLEKLLTAARSGHVGFVGDDDVNQVLRDLPGRCPQFEVQAKLLEEHLPQGRRCLVEIAASTYRPPGVMISNQAIKDWLAGLPQLNRHLTARGSYVWIEDPVLRRYVSLTRR